MRKMEKIKIEKITVPEIRATSKLSEEQERFFKATVERYGVLEPILVRKKGWETYELIAGKRRLDEEKAQGKKEVDAIVIEANDKDALMMHLAENWARGDSDPVNEALVLQQFIDKGGSIEEAASIVGHSPEWVKLRLSIAKLPEVYQDAVKDGVIGVGHVALASSLPTPEEVDHALSLAIKLNWTQPVMENYVRQRLAEHEAAELQGDMKEPPKLPTYEQAEQLAQTYTCSGCSRLVDRIQIRTPPICEECYTLVRYVTSQISGPKEAMQEIYQAIKHYREYLQWKKDKWTFEKFEEETGPRPPG